MNSIFAGVHIPDGTNTMVPLHNIDFTKTVQYLKEEVGRHIGFDPNNIEIIYNGLRLDNDLVLSDTIKPNAVVFCFRKSCQYTSKENTVDELADFNKTRIQELFSLTSNVQINVNSRVNILHKILSEYPEFRHNLGAHALIRDSVLFNTVHQPEVIDNLAKNYPIICKAAPFIVDTIKKELKKNSSAINISEPTTDTTSEDENSLGASSNSDRMASDSTNTENSRTTQVSRQQLQSALAFAFGSNNSLANIAQRNTETNASSSGSDSNERITSQLLRNELQRALNNIRQRTDPMETTEVQPDVSNTPPQVQAAAGDETGDVIPAHYRNHQYAEQLRTMAQMGFLNYEENLSFLNISNGNIENAVNLLMGSMN